MNYIKQLQKENLELKNDVVNMENKLNELLRHLSLEKFKVDTTIQVSDIKNWIEYIKNRVI